MTSTLAQLTLRASLAAGARQSPRVAAAWAARRQALAAIPTQRVAPATACPVCAMGLDCDA